MCARSLALNLELTYLKAGVSYGIEYLAPTRPSTNGQDLGGLVHFHRVKEAEIKSEAIAKAPQACCVTMPAPCRQEGDVVSRCQQHLKDFS